MSVNLVQSSLATLHVQVPISAILNGTTAYNPTGDPVALAFLPPGIKPVTSDWVAGTWMTNPGPEYLAQALIGPDGGHQLAAGVYVIWVKVTDNPETFVPPGGVGTLTIQ